jgi:hypothetical protein
MKAPTQRPMSIVTVIPTIKSTPISCAVGPSHIDMHRIDGSRCGLTAGPRLTAGRGLADVDSLAVEVDLDVQPSAECFDVAAKGADLGVPDTTTL